MGVIVSWALGCAYYHIHVMVATLGGLGGIDKNYIWLVLYRTYCSTQGHIRPPPPDTGISILL